MQIVIPDDYQDAVRHLDAFKQLTGHDVNIYNDSVKDVTILAERFRNADALVLIRERTPLDLALLAQLPKLKLIAQTGRGIPHIDVAACTKQGVAVAVGSGSPHSPAELTWALIMASRRRLPQEIMALRAGQWGTTPDLGRGLHGYTLGIFGYGKIGSLVASYGRVFGMRVLVWGREGSLARAQADGFETAPVQRELFERSDVLSLHLKLVNETRGIVTAADLAAMSPSALLVNTSRADLIASGALVATLQAGRPGYAAVDVYEQEPAPDNPLLAMDNVLGTPHLGYVEKDTYEDYFNTAFEQVLAFASGRLTSIVNPEALRPR